MEAINSMMDQIEAQVSTNKKIRLNDIQANMRQNKVSNDENFAKDKDFGAMQQMNQQWIHKSRKKNAAKESSPMRKASHERFLKGINQSFIKANGVGLD